MGNEEQQARLALGLHLKKYPNCFRIILMCLEQKECEGTVCHGAAATGKGMQSWVIVEWDSHKLIIQSRIKTVITLPV